MNYATPHHLNPSPAQATASVKRQAKIPKNVLIEYLHKTEAVIFFACDGWLLSVTDLIVQPSSNIQDLKGPAQD
jgi:hypothetical protein